MSALTTTDFEIEIWKPIPCFPYEASSAGRIRRVGSKPRQVRVNNRGYASLCITDGPRRYQVCVHVLVANAFHGPKPSSQHEVAHGNGIKTDNRALNLRWATKKENAADRDKHGTTARGDRSGTTKLPDRYISLIFADRARGLTQYQLAAKYLISQAQIWNILHGHQRKGVAGPRAAA